MEKASMFGDPSQLSSQLRSKAYEIINKSPRPLAACEIMSIIRDNEPVLWRKISTKCKDYTRIILSQEKSNKITKFKCVKPPNEVDKRANFFGISGRAYDSAHWIQVDEIKHKLNKKMYKSSSTENWSVNQSNSIDNQIDIVVSTVQPVEGVQCENKRVILPPLPSWVGENNKWCFQNLTFLGGTVIPSISLFN
jgi:hypothetical protein